MYGGTIREDPEYPGIFSIPDTVCEVVCMGGTTREDPGIISIPDTVSVRLYVWGGQVGRISRYSGSLVFRTLSVKGFVWGGQLGRIPG